MTTATAGNVAGSRDKDKEQEKEKEKDKEKVGMRRALGRGLASLLPGPRMVSSAAPAPAKPPAPLSVAPSAATPHSQAAGGTAVSVAATTAASGSVVVPEVVRDPGTRLGATAPPTNQPEPSGRPELGGKPAGHPEYPPPQDRSAEGGPITLQGTPETGATGNLVVNLAITEIDKNPYQTREVEHDDTLEELAASIQVNGIVQPIVVRPSEDGHGRYTLILGERRMHAAKKAGKTHVPALVRKVSAQQAAEMTIIENLQREDLSPLEQARAFKVLSTEFNLTQEEIGKRVGLSRASITNYMRLLKLPHEVMQLLAQKSLTFAEAKELLALENADQIAQAAVYAVRKGMTAEQIERMVLSMNGLLEPFPGMPGVAKKKTGARWVDPNVRAAQTDLERTLGLRVRIRDRKGKGKIVIEYSTVDDYERVVEMLRGKK
jgi:ParB family transcriptional regulator, chromosome partitioning protein